MIIKAIHHFGLVVNDLPNAVEFYVEKFGFHETGRVEWTTAPGRKLGIQADHVELRWAFIKLGQTVIELHQFRGVEQKEITRRTQDKGLGHIAFEVTDIEAAVDNLSQAGVRFFTAPTLLTDGFQRGDKWVYGIDPNDLLIELYQPTI